VSPLFHRRSEDQKAAEKAASRARAQATERSVERAAASLQRIEDGRVPLAAAERLGG
jgi:hypothetical protein